jgi:hypothetical protein
MKRKLPHRFTLTDEEMEIIQPGDDEVTTERQQ